MELILPLAIMVLSCIASAFSAIAIGCLLFPSVERLVGFCIVQFGLTVAYSALKLSVYGGRMVDGSRLSEEPKPLLPNVPTTDQLN